MDTQQDKDFQRADKYGFKIIFGVVWILGLVAGFLIGRGTAPKYDYNNEWLEGVKKGYANAVHDIQSSTATTTILEEKQRCEAERGELFLRGDSFYGIRAVSENDYRIPFHPRPFKAYDIICEKPSLDENNYEIIKYPK